MAQNKAEMTHDNVTSVAKIAVGGALLRQAVDMMREGVREMTGGNGYLDAYFFNHLDAFISGYGSRDCDIAEALRIGSGSSAVSQDFNEVGFVYNDGLQKVLDDKMDSVAEELMGYVGVHEANEEDEG
jgi:hypothetical protein